MRSPYPNTRRTRIQIQRFTPLPKGPVDSSAWLPMAIRLKALWARGVLSFDTWRSK